VPDRSDFALVENAVREAGAIARGFFGGDYKRWDKGKGQPVTEADIAVDRYLRQTLTRARPDYGWLSEETDDDRTRLSAANTFVVDPIDGTVAFMKGRPHFAVSVAVVRAERPVTACVYNPVSEEFFAAAKGEGARLNGVPIHVSGCAEIEDCRMLASKTLFEHPGWNTPPLAPWPPMQVETRNSIAYRMALVACGSFDAALVLSTKRDWDMAAADLIVQEAGGMVTDHLGAVLRYNRAETLQPSMVCAGTALHARLLERLRNLKLPR
jgi:myo-inositol-1(or 4)-monophosphatase